MYYYNVCMGCGYEWESDFKADSCPKCKVGDIDCDTLEEDDNDNQKQRIEKNAKRKGQTIHNNDVYK